jgi:hypothetical protein
MFGLFVVANLENRGTQKKVWKRLGLYRILPITEYLQTDLEPEAQVMDASEYRLPSMIPNARPSMLRGA